jgi:hypothetical protein
MEVIEALRTSILEPRDHLHINHDRMLRSGNARRDVMAHVGGWPAFSNCSPS